MNETCPKCKETFKELQICSVRCFVDLNEIKLIFEKSGMVKPEICNLDNTETYSVSLCEDCYFIVQNEIKSWYDSKLSYKYYKHNDENETCGEIVTNVNGH